MMVVVTCCTSASRFIQTIGCASHELNGGALSRLVTRNGTALTDILCDQNSLGEWSPSVSALLRLLLLSWSVAGKKRNKPTLQTRLRGLAGQVLPCTIR